MKLLFEYKFVLVHSIKGPEGAGLESVDVGGEHLAKMSRLGAVQRGEWHCKLVDRAVRRYHDATIVIRRSFMTPAAILRLLGRSQVLESSEHIQKT